MTASAVAGPPGSGGGREAWYVVGLLCGAGFISLLDRVVLYLLIDAVKADLSISDTQIGLLMGPAFALFYVLGALPFAWAIDRSNRKRVLAAGVALWSAATIAAAFAPNFHWLLVSRMLVGVGEGVVNPCAVSLIGDLFARHRRPTPTAAFMSSMLLGGTSSFLIVSALLDALAQGWILQPALLAEMPRWRTMLFLVGAPGMLIAALILLTMKEPRRGAFETQEDPQDARTEVKAFASRRAAFGFYVPFMIGCGLMSMISVMTVVWVPSYFIRTFRADVETVGYLFGLATMVGGVAGTLLLPMLAERLARDGRKDAMILVSMAAMPIMLMAFLGMTAAPVLGVGVMLIGISTGLNNGIISAPSVVITSLGSSGIRARLVAVYLLLQASIAYVIGPVAVPLVSERVFGGDLGSSMAALAVFSIPASFVLFAICRRPYARAMSYLDGYPRAELPEAGAESGATSQSTTSSR